MIEETVKRLFGNTISLVITVIAWLMKKFRLVQKFPKQPVAMFYQDFNRSLNWTMLLDSATDMIVFWICQSIVKPDLLKFLLIKA